MNEGINLVAHGSDGRTEVNERLRQNQGLKRCFSCRARQVRLAAGRVQTAGAVLGFSGKSLKFLPPDA